METAMLDNPYIDTIISLVLVYALLSILVSTLLETWNRRTKERGVFLQKVIFRLLDDPLNKNYGYLIYQHPIINKMRRDGNSFPHYIPAEGFANALIDTLAGFSEAPELRPMLEGKPLARPLSELAPEDRLRVTYAADEPNNVPLARRLTKGVKGMKESELKRLLVNFIDRNSDWKPGAGVDVQATSLNMADLKDEIGRWFDGYMERAGGEYKLNQRHKLLFLGFLVAIVLNVDSLHLAKVFLLDKDLRDGMVEEAERVADGYAAKKAEMAKDTLYSVELWAAARDSADTAEVKLRISESERRFLLVAMADSAYERQAEEVLTMVRNWQLPIGWNPGEAPLSWFDGRQLKQVPKEFKPSQRALLNHFKLRNTWDVRNAIKWMAGICITAYSLSLGAPFWFDLLVKLINIRRSGGKPQTTDERKAHQS